MREFVNNRKSFTLPARLGRSGRRFAAALEAYKKRIVEFMPVASAAEKQKNFALCPKGKWHCELLRFWRCLGSFFS
jgi:hypothetical protein